MLRLLLFLLLAILVTPASSIHCHSCLTQCELINGKVDPDQCDCQSPRNEQCSAKVCYAKVEIFKDENTAIVHKGCVSDVPAGQLGCQYANGPESITCYCKKDQCNIGKYLDDFKPFPLPQVKCCSCKSGESCRTGCADTCVGNYCVVDFDGEEQGCGMGYPRLPSFLRTNNYSKFQGEYLCTQYESVPSHKLNGCVCTHPSGLCNKLNETKAYQEKHVLKRLAHGQNYCYTLMHKSYKPFGQDVFKGAAKCTGHFCFVSLTSSELVLESADFKSNMQDHDEFVGFWRPRYELQAGCIKVDDDTRVTIGCTVETQGNNSEIMAAHCVCDSHLCNYHHLLRGTEDPRPKSEDSKIQMKLNSKPIQPNPNRLYTEGKQERYSTVLVASSNSFHTFYLIVFNILQLLLFKYI